MFVRSRMVGFLAGTIADFWTGSTSPVNEDILHIHECVTLPYKLWRTLPRSRKGGQSFWPARLNFVGVSPSNIPPMSKTQEHLVAVLFGKLAYPEEP